MPAEAAGYRSRSVVMSIHAVTVRVLRIPLHTPYRVSRTVFHHFEPIVV